jgi:hypothetical protein
MLVTTTNLPREVNQNVTELVDQHRRRVTGCHHDGGSRPVGLCSLRKIIGTESYCSAWLPHRAKVDKGRHHVYGKAASGSTEPNKRLERSTNRESVSIGIGTPLIHPGVRDSQGWEDASAKDLPIGRPVQLGVRRRDHYRRTTILNVRAENFLGQPHLFSSVVDKTYEERPSRTGGQIEVQAKMLWLLCLMGPVSDRPTASSTQRDYSAKKW